MKLNKRITIAIATGAVLLNALAPVALADQITVTGNGAFSDNSVDLKTNTTTVVNQTNNANVTNNVSSNASTGGNSSSFNTGGDSRIVTGDATNNVNVSTAVNLNKADVSCGCDNAPVDVKISGNGAYSDNDVKVKTTNDVYLTQDNNARVTNDVNANSNTGKNDSSFNTGGDSVIVTGDASTNVSVDNKANANIARIGVGAGDHSGSSVNITGNGAYSDNDVYLKAHSAIVLDQNNDANIYNDVYAKAKTGNNDSSFNTGGETVIVTGDARTNVDVDNLVNFNWADVNCDCVLGDLGVKIGGNGAYSDSDVKVKTKSDLFNNQDNWAGLYNDVYGKAKTGYNDVAFSTGDVHGDPIVATGDASSSTDVSNAGNVNLFNQGVNLHLPGDWELHTHFDLGDLLSFLMLG